MLFKYLWSIKVGSAPLMELQAAFYEHKLAKGFLVLEYQYYTNDQFWSWMPWNLGKFQFCAVFFCSVARKFVTPLCLLQHSFNSRLSLIHVRVMSILQKGARNVCRILTNVCISVFLILVHVDIELTTYLPYVDNCGHLTDHLPTLRGQLWTFDWPSTYLILST